MLPDSIKIDKGGDEWESLLRSLLAGTPRAVDPQFTRILRETGLVVNYLARVRAGTADLHYFVE